MISKSILPFLKALKVNNDRDWFQKNKKAYTDAKSDFEHITEFLIHGISQFDKSVTGLSPKECIFRIFRDVRFSKDKSPYKTNFGTFITKGGRKGGNAGYYLHIEPDNSFIAGGIYMPPSPVLKVIREEIYNNIDEFKDILNESEFKSVFKEIEGEKLVNPPKGFDKSFADIELLKHKHYTVFTQISDEELIKNNFLEQAIETFELMFPFNRFLNNAVHNIS